MGRGSIGVRNRNREGGGWKNEARGGERQEQWYGL